MFRAVFEVDREIGWVVWRPRNSEGRVQATALFWMDREQSPESTTVQYTNTNIVTAVMTPWGTWTGSRVAALIHRSGPTTQALCCSPGGISGGSFMVGALPIVFKKFPGPWTCLTGNSIGAVATAFLANEPPGQELVGVYRMAKAVLTAPNVIFSESSAPIGNGNSFKSAQYLEQQISFNSMEQYGRDVSWGSTAVSSIGLVDRSMQAYNVFRPQQFVGRPYDAALSVVASTTICSIQYSPMLDQQEWIDGGYLDMLPLRNFEYLADRIVTIAASHRGPDNSLPTVTALWDRSWARYDRQVEFLRSKCGVQVVTVQAARPISSTPDPLDRSFTNMLQSVLVGVESAENQIRFS